MVIFLNSCSADGVGGKYYHSRNLLVPSDIAHGYSGVDSFDFMYCKENLDSICNWNRNMDSILLLFTSSVYMSSLP